MNHADAIVIAQCLDAIGAVMRGDETELLFHNAYDELIAYRRTKHECGLCHGWAVPSEDALCETCCALEDE